MPNAGYTAPSSGGSGVSAQSINTAGTLAGAGLSLFGANKAAGGYKDMAKAARDRGRQQKVFNYSAAKQLMASGQAGMFEETRQAELVASRAVAVAAAGGYIQDIDHLIADIHGEGAYRASLLMRESEQDAEALRFAGDQAQRYGEEQYDYYKGLASATKTSAFGSILKVGVVAAASYFGGPAGGAAAGAAMSNQG